MYVKSLQSCLSLCKPMDCGLQAPLSMGFSRQEYCNGLPCPPPGDLSDISCIVGRFFTHSATWEAPYVGIDLLNCSLVDVQTVSCYCINNNAIIKLITTVIFLFLEQIFKKRIAMLKE